MKAEEAARISKEMNPVYMDQLYSELMQKIKEAANKGDEEISQSGDFSKFHLLEDRLKEEGYYATRLYFLNRTEFCVAWGETRDRYTKKEKENIELLKSEDIDYMNKTQVKLSWFQKLIYGKI